jgi:uncharacterized protein YaeQ
VAPLQTRTMALKSTIFKVELQIADLDRKPTSA